MIYGGIDLGGTTIKAALVNEEGDILLEKRIPTGAEREAEDILQDMASLVQELLGEAEIPQAELKAVGIGSPGPVDPDRGIVKYATNFASFIGIPVAGRLQELLRVPVFLENDANIAAYGESLKGAGQGSGSSVVITLGTGLGSGIILDGKIYSGFHHNGAEMGLAVIAASGIPCSTGRKGGWEAYSSASALIRMGKEHAKAHPESKLFQQGGEDLAKLNAKDIFDAAEEGDEAATEALQEYIHYLAIGLGNVIYILDPEYLIIGGGPSAQGEKLLAPLRDALKEELFDGNLQTQVVTATLGNRAGIIGAALYAKERMETIQK